MTRLERSVAVVLRAGVFLSSVCLAIGLSLSLTQAAPGLADRLLQIGILVLLCTPVARVCVSRVAQVLRECSPDKLLLSSSLLRLDCPPEFGGRTHCFYFGSSQNAVPSSAQPRPTARVYAH